MNYKSPTIKTVLAGIITLTIGLGLAADKESPEKPGPEEYKLTYGVIKDEKEFSSKSPIWLPLEKLPLYAEEDKAPIVTVLHEGEEYEVRFSSLKKGYLGKILPRSVLKLDLVLNKIKAKYHIRVRFQTDQWVYQRAYYRKLTIPEGTLCFFDENTNGRYNDYGIDGFVLPGSFRIVKLQKEIYLGKEENACKYLLDLDETGTKIRLTKVLLGGNPVYLEALVYFNRLRLEADLPQVELNEKLCRGCELHAKYLVLNGKNSPSAHKEDPLKPGYTSEGAKAAKNSGIHYRQPNMITAINGWMNTFSHRTALLHPGTRTIGMGLYKGTALLDAYSDYNFFIDYEPIHYPYEGQKNVPLTFGHRMPLYAGYPITLTFKKGTKITEAVASLTDAQYKPVECYFSSPEKPANPKRSDNKNTICLIPKQELKNKTKYTVEIKCKVNEEAFMEIWSFTTK